MNLRVRSRAAQGLVTEVTAQDAGWQYLNFALRRLGQSESWRGDTGEHEMGIVWLGGTGDVTSSRGNWAGVGRRAHVFEGMPYALYLPRHTQFTVTARTAMLELAVGWCTTDRDFAACLVEPQHSAIEIRGGGHATRQINSIMPPGFPCQRLVCVEVYTPGGNWSSYPPHKHDVRRLSSAGQLLEADLEEIYYYQFDRPAGFAVQRVYTLDGRLDETLTAQQDDVILVPEGFHPVSAAQGYTTYYLNFLAGSDQSLANSDDPAHAWVKETWTWKDDRLPVVSHDMERPTE